MAQLDRHSSYIASTFSIRIPYGATAPSNLTQHSIFISKLETLERLNARTNHKGKINQKIFLDFLQTFWHPSSWLDLPPSKSIQFSLSTEYSQDTDGFLFSKFPVFQMQPVYYHNETKGINVSLFPLDLFVDHRETLTSKVSNFNDDLFWDFRRKFTALNSLFYIFLSLSLSDHLEISRRISRPSLILGLHSRTFAAAAQIISRLINHRSLSTHTPHVELYPCRKSRIS